jgi:hypothetical protein
MARLKDVARRPANDSNHGDYAHCYQGNKRNSQLKIAIHATFILHAQALSSKKRKAIRFAHEGPSQTPSQIADRPNVKVKRKKTARARQEKRRA